MPQKWTEKDERQYEKIKRSARSRGMSQKRAKEMAARTVNSRRREEGRTPNRTTQGTGNPNDSYEERSKTELYNIAKSRHIKGRSAMSKQDLIEALRA
jgi:hypothetical protein